MTAQHRNDTAARVARYIANNERKRNELAERGFKVSDMWHTLDRRVRIGQKLLRELRVPRFVWSTGDVEFRS